jgi:zinc transporter ZupT
MIVLAIAVGAFCATLLGGIFALRLRDRRHLMLGFSAGAVIGVAFFDLLPEAIEIGGKYDDVPTLISIAALGFLTYLSLDRFLLFGRQIHPADSPDCVRRGVLAAGGLSTHSFLDGLAIGFGFQASTAIGTVVTAAVLTHDFSDGLNTINVVLKGGGDRTKALLWLLIDAVAPVFGVVATFMVVVPDRVLGIILALFAGLFLYLGASDLIPESHHAHPSFLTTVMTLLGAAVLYIIEEIVR